MIDKIKKNINIIYAITLIIFILVNLNLKFKEIRIMDRALTNTAESRMREVYLNIYSIEEFLKSVKKGYEIKGWDIINAAYACDDIKLKIDSLKELPEEYRREIANLSQELPNYLDEVKEICYVFIDKRKIQEFINHFLVSDDYYKTFDSEDYFETDDSKIRELYYKFVKLNENTKESVY